MSASPPKRRWHNQGLHSTQDDSDNPDELLTTYHAIVAASGRLDAAAQLALLPRDTRAITAHEMSA